MLFEITGAVQHEDAEIPLLSLLGAVNQQNVAVMELGLHTVAADAQRKVGILGLLVVGNEQLACVFLGQIDAGTGRNGHIVKNDGALVGGLGADAFKHFRIGEGEHARGSSALCGLRHYTLLLLLNDQQRQLLSVRIQRTEVLHH